MTLQNYTEFIRTNHQFSNWTELSDGFYPQVTDFVTGSGGFGGYPIYSEEGVDPQGNQHTNPNNDVFFNSKYNELIYNLVLRWEIDPRSTLYFVYTRYWMVNGKRFKTFFNFLDYSEENPFVESSFDQGISLKYTYQFDI